jgi:hypothetical protein
MSGRMPAGGVCVIRCREGSVIGIYEVWDSRDARVEQRLGLKGKGVWVARSAVADRLANPPGQIGASIKGAPKVTSALQYGGATLWPTRGSRSRALGSCGPMTGHRGDPARDRREPPPTADRARHLCRRTSPASQKQIGLDRRLELRWGKASDSTTETANRYLALCNPTRT